MTLALYEQGVEAYLGASNPTPHPTYEELLHRVVSGAGSDFEHA